MLRLRLTRTGKKNSAFYGIVVQEQDFFRDGRFIEKIGFYNPSKNQRKLSLNKERFDYWIQKGAQPSTTVKSLIRRLHKN